MRKSHTNIREGDLCIVKETENVDSRAGVNKDFLDEIRSTYRERSTHDLRQETPVIDRSTSSDKTEICKGENVEEEDHVSKDRLVEIVEGKLEQLNLGGTGEDAMPSRIDKPPSYNAYDEKDDIKHDTSGGISVEFHDGESEVSSHKCSVNVFSEVGASDTECTESQEVLKRTVSACQSEVSQNSSMENLCVSSLDCTFTISQLSINMLGTGQTSEDGESERPKRKLTVSWDPVPLLNQLYELKFETLPEKTTQLESSTEYFLNILPFGAFESRGGKYYAVLEKNCLYFYESEKKQKCVLHVPLKYANLYITDENILMLDNKMGRCFWMEFASEDEMENVKASIQRHCRSFSPSKYLQIVHYPLKSNKDVIIIDLGSCSTRAGILMDQPTLPMLFFPSVCATDKKMGIKKYGISALMSDVRKTSTLSFPVRQSAKITKFTMDIDAVAGLFKHIFCELRVDPKKYTVQVCIPRSLSTNTQIALMKLLLEEFCVESVSLTRQALLTLYANNVSTAIVVDIGDRMEILPVVDGFILEGGVNRLPYGGQRLIHHMKHALAQKHVSLSNDVESFLVQYILQNICYIAENYEEEMEKATANPKLVRKSVPLHSFLKDNTKLQTVWLDIGRFQVPEGLFKPDQWGLDFPGLHKLVHQAIQVSGMDARRQMAESIYVSGGVTLLPGFVERLENEVAKLTLPRLMPKVHASPYRHHMTYIGACQLASSNQFHQVCINAKEWEESGAASLKKWHL